VRILVIEGIASSSYGGAEKSMSKFCEFLLTSENSVFLVCEDYGKYGVSRDNTKKLNLQSFSQQGLLSYLKTVFAIVKYIKKNKIELICTHCIHIFPLIKLVKILTNVKTLIYFKWVYNNNDIGVLNRWGLNNFDQYVAINEFVGNYWESQINKKIQFKYVADGIIFPNKNKVTSPANDKKRLLYFGRIYKGKGLHLLLEALAILPKNYELIVLGDYRPNDINNKEVEYHKSLENLIVNLNLANRVQMMGHVLNVEDYLNSNTSLVVVPSIIDDAQPFSILESISYMCPVIGTNSGGIPYIYNFNDFWYCKPESHHLADKINMILGLSNDILSKEIQELYNSVYKRYNICNTQIELKNMCELTLSI
jgi:glycosyltransferase involved in cell wall biosynthesis